MGKPFKGVVIADVTDSVPDSRGRQLERRYSDAELRDRRAGGGLRILLAHDDAEREFDYKAGAEKALERAASAGWTVASIKDDWSTVFAESDS